MEEHKVGYKKGKLTLLEWTKDHPVSVRGSLWKSVCDCGSIRWIANYTLKISKDPMCRDCSRKKPRVSKEHRTYRHVYSQYKANARSRKGVEFKKQFDLTFEQVVELITQDCYYCGEAPTTVNKKFKDVPYNGIDRIDSEIGYCVDNVRPCCTTCNMMKGSLTEEEFFGKIKQIEEKHK